MKGRTPLLLLLTCLAGVNGLEEVIFKNPRNGQEVTFKQCTEDSWVKKTYISRHKAPGPKCYPYDDDADDKWLPSYTGCYCTNYMPLSRKKISLEDCQQNVQKNSACTHEFWHSWWGLGPQTEYHFQSSVRTGFPEKDYDPTYTCGCVRQETTRDENTGLMAPRECETQGRKWFWTFECCPGPNQKDYEKDEDCGSNGLKKYKIDGEYEGKCVKNEDPKHDQSTDTCSTAKTEKACQADDACEFQYDYIGCCTDPAVLGKDAIPTVDIPCQLMYQDPETGKHDEEKCKANASCGWDEAGKKCYLPARCSMRDAEDCEQKDGGVQTKCTWLKQAKDCVCNEDDCGFW